MRRLLALLRSLWIMAPLIGPWFVFARDRGLSATLFNADALFASSLYFDLFANAGRLSAWSFPPPGFFFPDLAVYFALAAGGLEFPAAVFAYGWVQFAALYGGVLFFISGIAGKGERRSAVAAGAFTLLGMAATGRAPATFYLFTLTHHTGAFVLAVWAAGCCIRDRRGWTALLSVLGTGSDPLFVGFFVIPALGASAFAPVSGADGSGRRARQFASLILPAMIGRSLFVLLRSRDWFLLPDPGDSGDLLDLERWTVLLEAGWQSLLESPPITIGLIAGFVVLCGRMFRSRERGARTWFAAFCALSVLACLAMGLAGALLLRQAQFASRYLLPALCWPAFALFLFLYDRYETIGWAAALLAAAGLFGFAGEPRRHGPEIFTYRHPVVSCLEREAGLRDGLAAYALAKPVDLFRRRAGNVFRVNQIDANGHPYLWMNSAAWFDPPGDPPRYNFILTAGLSEPELEKKFGPPARRAQCPLTGVWIYDEPLPAPSPGEIRIWRALIGR